MQYVEMDLIIFWIFFGFLSILPMILAIYTQRKSDKKEEELIKRGRTKK